MGRRRTHNRHLPPRMQLKSGTYYHTPYVHGRVRWRSLGKEYGDALRQWAELEGQRVTPGQTVADAIDRYVIDALPHLGSRTQQDYRRSLGVLRQVFGEMALADLHPSHVAQLLDQAEAKVAANRHVAVLSAVYRHAMRWGWCQSNPCQGVRRNKETARDRYVDDQELNTAIELAPRELGLAMQFAYLTALDLSDMLALKHSDIVDYQGTRVIRSARGKTGQRVTVELTDSLEAIISATKHRQDGQPRSIWIFSNRRGQQYTTDGFQSIWQAFRRRHGIDWRWKDLRAKALTDVQRERGRDAAQALAAHASGNTTEVYIRARDRVVVKPVK
jgi:integrase